MGHKLSLDIRDSINDNRFIQVSDYSIYDEVLGVNRKIFQVLPPYTDQYIKIPFLESGTKALSTTDLELTTGIDIGDLPDGLYKFHYSIAPNDKVFIAINHFRTARLMNEVIGKMMLISVECTASVDQCGNIEINKYQNMLLHIWLLLTGAQAVGRNEYAIAQARNLYDQANKAFNVLYNIDNCKIC